MKSETCKYGGGQKINPVETGTGRHKMSLEHFVMSGSKEMLMKMMWTYHRRQLGGAFISQL